MKDYIEQCVALESTNWYEPNRRLLHAAMGLVTESSELMSSVSKENFVEELGDVLWYVAIACDVLEISLDEAEESAGNFEFRPHLGVEDMILASSDIMDMLKKSTFYGKALHRHAVATRLGEILVVIENLSDYPLGEIMASNLTKLHKRYSSGTFSQKEALNRDVQSEMNHF